MGSNNYEGEQNLKMGQVEEIGCWNGDNERRGVIKEWQREPGNSAQGL